MARSEERNRRYYTPGTAARDFSAAPQIEYPSENDILKRRIKRRAIRRANRRNFLYLLVILGITAVLFGVCVQYLSLRGVSSAKSGQIATLQEELNQLKIKNDETQDDINTNINYNDIYNKAKNEYGMVYPGAVQIRNYTIEDSGYIKQYQNIP